MGSVGGRGPRAASEVLQRFRGTAHAEGYAGMPSAKSAPVPALQPSFSRGVVVEEFAFANAAPNICTDRWPIWRMIAQSLAPLRVFGIGFAPAQNHGHAVAKLRSGLGFTVNKLHKPRVRRADIINDL